MHSRRTVPTQRSAKAFALGALTGHLMTRAPSEANTASKAAVNLASQSRPKNLRESPLSSRSPTRLRHLGGPWAVGVPGHTEDMDDPALHFDRKEHRELGEPHGVDGEKVCGQDAFGLGTEELGPALCTAGSWPKAGSPQDAPDRGSPHPEPQLGQLALHAHAPPAAVLPGQADYQLDRLFRKGRPSPALLRPPPPPPSPGNLPVPAQERLGLDQERSPAVLREHLGQRGQEGAVCGPVAGPAFDLALEDFQLVTED